MRRSERSGTPVPNRAFENRSCGTGTVREYTLSPEELEEIRLKYPATKQDKKFKAPIEIKTKSKEASKVGKFTMTEAEFKAARESGKTIAKIAEEQDVAEATVYANMKRWEAAGKEPEQKLLREKEAASPADVQQLDKAIHEIERLTAQIFGLEESNGYLRNEVERWKSKANEAATLFIAEHDSAQKELIRAIEENDRLKDEINRMITERDELVRENDEFRAEKTTWTENERILNHLVEQLRSDLQKRQQTEPQLADKPSEVQLLDQSIADLTRARWILNRLNASGE